jgi:flagellar L-ring protein precursor FlgH
MSPLLKQVLRGARFGGLAAGLLSAATVVQAQDSSLFRQDLPTDGRRPLLLAETSFYFQPVEPPKELRRTDIVTVIVQEQSKVVSEGDVQRRKKSKMDAQLKNWVELDGLNLKVAPQIDGQPRANGTLDSEFTTNMQLETGDRMSFKIAARIVDVRPNGNFVLEAHRTINNNSEVWEQSLTGVVRREDILPNNTVLSEDIAELMIEKRERGHVRDSYRRGWLIEIWDAIGPF